MARVVAGTETQSVRMPAGPDGGGRGVGRPAVVREVHARVGDALPVGERLPERGRACPPAGSFPSITPVRPPPGRSRRPPHHLPAVVLAAVAVAGVHHQPARQPGRRNQVQCLGGVTGLVVRAAPAAAQDHVGVRVARRGSTAATPLMGHAEGVADYRRASSRHLDVAVRAVLEPDRDRQA